MTRQHYRNSFVPEGIWTTRGKVDYSDVYREVRPTLKVALELGRWRAFAAGAWWTFTPTYEPLVENRRSPKHSFGKQPAVVR